jgi:RimJ/RimL family protein N-acetyltransferase
MSDATTPVIEASPLLLRHVRLTDAAAFLRLSQEEGMRSWLPDQVYADQDEALRAMRFLTDQYGPLADPRSAPHVFAVCIAASGEVVGHVGFSPCEYGVEVGYAIGEAHQNLGYARQALRAASGWALSRFNLPVLHAIVAAENVASCRVVESCGVAIQSATRRKLHGVERSVRHYALSHAKDHEV